MERTYGCYQSLNLRYAGMVVNRQHRLGWVNCHLGIEDTCLADECPSNGMGLVGSRQAMYDKSVLVRHLNGMVNRWK